MASKFLCSCGETVRTNIYSGHRIRFLVPEENTDLPDDQAQGTVNDFIDELVRRSIFVAECPNCKALALIDKDYNIKMYAPVAN